MAIVNNDISADLFFANLFAPALKKLEELCLSDEISRSASERRSKSSGVRFDLISFVFIVNSFKVDTYALN